MTYGPKFTEGEKQQLVPHIEQAIAIHNKSEWHWGSFTEMVAGSTYLFSQGIEPHHVISKAMAEREKTCMALYG